MRTLPLVMLALTAGCYQAASKVSDVMPVSAKLSETNRKGAAAAAAADTVRDEPTLAGTWVLHLASSGSFVSPRMHISGAPGAYTQGTLRRPSGRDSGWQVDVIQQDRYHLYIHFRNWAGGEAYLDAEFRSTNLIEGFFAEGNGDLLRFTAERL